MRPVRLEMRGFTAFRDPTEIDFTDLDLFALWGPMGSGKSSVLDAMTYALYGKVERIGSSISQLVSQGQPRMSVLFEFDVAEHRYRITRSTPAKGSTKVLFERHDGSDWKSHGEGADRAREVNKTLTDLIGLDYPAFTRAVLLPQGKFAEFLTGDAAERRKILTELLGLELFGRMASIARSVADQAKADVGARLSLLDQYADVDNDAVKEATASAKAAKALAAEAGTIEKELEGFSKRGDELDKKVEALTECSEEAIEVAEQLEAHARGLQELAQAASGYASRIEEAKKVAERARLAHEEAKAEIDRATERWGKLDELVETRRLVGALVSARNELATTESSARDAEAALEKARARETEVRDVLEKAAASAADAEHEEKELAVRLELAQKVDLIGSLTHDLTKGDACPVCERPLERIPAGNASELKKAKEAHVKAAVSASAAREFKNEKQMALAVAENDVKAATERLSRCTDEKARRSTTMDDLAAQVAAGFKTKVPEDVETVIEERIVATRALIAYESTKAKESQDAATSQGALEREAAAITEKVAAAKGAIAAAPLNGCVRRAAKVVSDTKQIALPKSLPDSPDDLAEVAMSVAAALRGLASDLEKARATTVRERAALSDAALKVMSPILDNDVPAPAGDVAELIVSFRNLVRDLEKRAASAAEAARSVKADMDKRKALEKEVAEKKAVDATYRSLAKELRGDHLVDHLQSEALIALAAAGSVRLTYLSAGRYRLSYESDEFFVIDGWNGEERRSVRTLSGGETFLASLALALALSDEVKNLAVTDKAPIESLFLDEGFGSLDAETLDTVVSAVEQLGGDGRMVGVITHVADVAERLPVKLVVTKSPRGSRIEREIQGSIQRVG